MANFLVEEIVAVVGKSVISKKVIVEIFSTMAFLVRLLVKLQIKVCNLFWLISLKHLHKWLLISFQLL